jgi:hypothetical protein
MNSFRFLSLLEVNNNNNNLSAYTFIIQRSASSRLSFAAPGSLGTAYSS